ncbi:MAG: hypothetical protein ABSH56_24590 [Bryobacteraceae bacterium]
MLTQVFLSLATARRPRQLFDPITPALDRVFMMIDIGLSELLCELLDSKAARI